MAAPLTPIDPEAAIEPIPYFRGMRPDERVRVAARLALPRLQPGATYPLGDAVLVVVLAGELTLAREGTAPIALHAGDWTDDLRAVAGHGIPGVLTARQPAALGVLDRDALDALFAELPALAVPFLGKLGRELRSRNDLLREVYLARAAGLSPAAFRRVLAFRRRRLQREPRVALRRAGALLVRALVVEPSRRLAFWILAGASLALVSARTVVGMILHRHLQGRLFALIGTSTGHPIHVHHFNYGLILVSLVGLLTMVPRTRQALRTLAFAFGFGLGLVVDEFALLWNLNPDYYQPSSRLAAALVLFGLFQLVYFGSLYAAMGRRLHAWVRA